MLGSQLAACSTTDHGTLFALVQVIIQGFRSYRDQTVVDPFSPKHNVIGEYMLTSASRSSLNININIPIHNVSGCTLNNQRFFNIHIAWSTLVCQILIGGWGHKSICAIFSVTVGRNGSGKSNFFYGMSAKTFILQLSNSLPTRLLIFIYLIEAPFYFISHPVCAQRWVQPPAPWAASCPAPRKCQTHLKSKRLFWNLNALLKCSWRKFLVVMLIVLKHVAS